MKKGSKKKKTNNLEKQFNLYVNSSLFLALIMVAVGLVLYNVPDVAMKTVSWLIGVFFILKGVLAIFSYSTKEKNTLMSMNLIYGILAIALGVFVILNPFTITNILAISFGIYLIISGALKINYAIQLKKVKESSWSVTLGVGIIAILFAFMVIINPFVKLFLVEVIGLFLIVYGLIDLTNAFLLRKRAKEFLKSFK